jgi:hypothetical protein
MARVVWALVAGPLAAQVASGPPAIRTTGEATVMARPDRARIDIGVVTQAATAQAAGAQNARQLETVLAELRKALGPAADIRTASYSLHPNYRHPRDGGQPAVTGYTAANTVEITTSDLDAVGRIIDAATQAGANQVQRLQFLLKDEQSLRARALRQAALEARASAETLAGTLGLKISAVLLVEEGPPQVVRPMREMVMQAAAASTPIEPGTIEVRATVTLTLAVTQ